MEVLDIYPKICMFSVISFLAEKHWLKSLSATIGEPIGHSENKSMVQFSPFKDEVRPVVVSTP